MNVARAYGLVLKQARTDAGLTQSEVGARAGYSPEYISLLENGRRGPSLTAVIDLANALYLSPVEVMTRVMRKIKQ